MPLINHRTIQGEPIRVGQREIVPEAQVTWFMRRNGTLGGDGSTSGWGAGFVRVRPTALVESGPHFSRRIPIRDETARLLAGLVAGAVFVVFLAQVAERLALSKGGSK